MRALPEHMKHLGIVLDVSRDGFDKSATAMGSIFLNDDDADKWYLFYTGAADDNWSQSSIGLATSTNGFQFKKNSEGPLFEADNENFYCVQALNPAVARVNSRFYMIFSGRFANTSWRRLGIAFAGDPQGPWQVIGELIKPTHFWEGNSIDNGCSVVKLDEETLLLYYSSLMSPKAYDFSRFLRRYPIRRIGILKVRIRGTSLSSIEAMRFSGNPLKHLNGSKGSWNESVFCPGHIKLNDTHHLFPAASTYSVGFPYKQYIGMVNGDSPYFFKQMSQTRKLIDGPSEKTKIIPNIKNEIALDTPTPYLNVEQRKLFLYYSVAERVYTRNETWKIALTTFDIVDQKSM